MHCASKRIQVSAAETRPPEMVKIAQPVLIWSKVGVRRAPPHWWAVWKGGPDACWHGRRLRGGRASRGQWSQGSSARVPTSLHGLQYPGLTAAGLCSPEAPGLKAPRVAGEKRCQQCVTAGSPETCKELDGAGGRAGRQGTADNRMGSSASSDRATQDSTLSPTSHRSGPGNVLHRELAGQDPHMDGQGRGAAGTLTAFLLWLA